MGDVVGDLVARADDVPNCGVGVRGRERMLRRRVEPDAEYMVGSDRSRSRVLLWCRRKVNCSVIDGL